jgi:hypothetical protein
LRRQRTSLVAAVALLLLIVAAPLRATGLVDPLLQFRQIRTAHFVIYFHAGEEPLAARLAALVEHVRDEIGAALGTRPPLLTHVVVADQAELANGWATPFPRDIVFLNAAVPSGAETIGRTDDWLRLVFTHEYTHIVHLDRSRSWAWLARGIFGRTPAAFPNVSLPQWQIEGLATWEESAITAEGRLFAGDFRAIQRVAAADGRPLSLDRAGGGLVRWPAGHAAYAAGLGFHDYLVERFGAETLGILSTRTAGRLPFFSSGAFKKVFGQSLGTLWRDYSTSLERTVSSQRTAPEGARRLTGHGNLVSGPRFAPGPCSDCLDEIVYSLQGPHAFPSLRAMTVEGTDDRELTTRYLGSTAGVHGTTIVFDQQELRRNVGQYSDLYALDRPTGRVRALTRDGRLQDPDVSQDGSRVVAVRENRGRRELVIGAPSADAARSSSFRAPSAPGDTSVVVSEPDTQFAAPRWSPDGRFVVVERWMRGTLPHLAVVDAQSGRVVQTLAIENSRVVTPAWMPDGRAIVAAADVDRGPFELYEFPVDGDARARRLTRSAGALWPDVSHDGRTLVFAGYTADGYDVFTRPYPAAPSRGDARSTSPAGETDAARAFLRGMSAAAPGQPPLDERPEADGAADRFPLVAAARPYSPLRTLLPTSWTPLLGVNGEQTRVGAGTAGADVLGRHAYAVGVTWLASGPDGIEQVPATPDWSATYAYARWRPSLFVTLSRDTLFPETVADDGSVATTRAVERQAEAGVFLPVAHVRTRMQAVASLVRSDLRYFVGDGLDGPDVVPPLRRTVAARFGAGFESSRQYGYSISREDGASIGSTLEIARRSLGSRARASTTTLDARVYLPGLRRHHVVAVRAAGGVSSGDVGARQSFSLDSVAASPSVVDFGSTALGLMRGGVDGGSGTRVLVGNAEYRFPLAVVEHGPGTWPIFLRTIHAAVFADVGSLRGRGADPRMRHAVGAELGATGVAGYALPFTASVGIAVGGTDPHRRGVALYGRIGRSF